MGGNLVTSLHRKLGDMYEAIFQYLLKERFCLTDDELRFSVDVKIGERIQKRSTDGLIPAKRYGNITLPSSLKNWQSSAGIGFEVKSCYQIGDSKKIQADWDMALALSEKNLIPVMLIFCNTSLVSPVIRLAKSWNLFEGEDTFRFVHELTGFDLYGFFRNHRKVFTDTALSYNFFRPPRFRKTMISSTSKPFRLNIFERMVSV